MRKIIPIVIALVGVLAGLFLFRQAGVTTVPAAPPPCADAALMPQGAPYLIAARGAPDHRPSPTWVGFTMSGVFEHTLPAYQRARARGLSAFDAALRVSADGEVLLMEEGDIARTTEGEGPVAVLTWDALKGLDAGGGAPIPRLPELLEALEGPVTFHFRLPAGEGGAAVARALGAGIGPGVEGPVWVASSDPEVLMASRRGAPRLLPALIVSDVNVLEGALARAQDACPLAVEVPAADVTEAVIKAARDAGAVVIASGVETEAEWARLKDLGVHGALTPFTSLSRESSPVLPPQGMVETVE